MKLRCRGRYLGSTRQLDLAERRWDRHCRRRAPNGAGAAEVIIEAVHAWIEVDEQLVCEIVSAQARATLIRIPSSLDE
ncbi:hypothetical protein [Rhodococcus sp. H29-C3]|uniref:hypothetical protein n=1 Tax=Rhodococcus sp. H29-C3 TaxID=3046307 RepID=UPI0024B8D373|nr:hypothetical protein [Rhodococcus sp. H29-C3]